LAADFPAVPQYRQDLARSHNNLGALLAERGKRAEAEAALRQALSIQEKLAADFPTVPQYRIHLGGSQVNFGNLLRDNHQPQQALDWYGKAMATLESVLRQVKGDVTARHFLHNAQWGRALSRVALGQVDAAIQDAEELAKDADANYLYDAACVFALAAGRRDETGSSVSKEQCAQRAVALLQQAVAKGYKDADEMQKDNDLKALRQRSDFQKLLAQLQKKSP
jgi:tetratricopeptide (TPR) repeat protein